MAAIAPLILGIASQLGKSSNGGDNNENSGLSPFGGGGGGGLLDLPKKLIGSIIPGGLGGLTG